MQTSLIELQNLRQTLEAQRPQPLLKMHSTDNAVQEKSAALQQQQNKLAELQEVLLLGAVHACSMLPVKGSHLICRCSTLCEQVCDLVLLLCILFFLNALPECSAILYWCICRFTGCICPLVQLSPDIPHRWCWQTTDCDIAVSACQYCSLLRPT